MRDEDVLHQLRMADDDVLTRGRDVRDVAVGACQFPENEAARVQNYGSTTRGVRRGRAASRSSRIHPPTTCQAGYATRAAVRHVGSCARSARGSGRVRPEDEDRAVRFSNRSRHDDFAPCMPSAERMLAPDNILVHVVVDNRVMSQNENSASLYRGSRGGRLVRRSARSSAYGSTAWPAPSAARAA